MNETKISSKSDRRFLARSVQMKLPLLHVQFVCVCFLFSMGKSMSRMGLALFVSEAITFYSFALRAAKVPLGKCSRVSLP